MFKTLDEFEKIIIINENTSAFTFITLQKH